MADVEEVVVVTIPDAVVKEEEDKTVLLATELSPQPGCVVK